jgi:hypothetical protein
MLVWCGIYNAVVGLALLLPPVYTLVGIKICNPDLARLIACLLAFTCVAYVHAANEPTRSIPLLHGLAALRIACAAVLIPAGIYGELGLTSAVLGGVDLCIGLAMFVALEIA